MDRHRGGINSLFMDWSVRKVGVKECWTLKWSPTYNTAGPWTKQGGVRPEDWPPWMRRFKDY
jgi:prepilin-type processing-associated H-X9-DG protein